MTDSLYILTVIAALVVASEWLVRRTPLRHIGSALLVIILGAIVANLGLIPTASTEAAPVPLYDVIFGHVAPVAIFWLLLSVNLRDVLKAGLPLIALFLLGAVGTILGVIAGMRVIDGPATIGPSYGALAGMFAGTYIGGSVNFNAIALHYGVMRDAMLYAGAVVADNIATTLWIMITLAVPRLMARRWPRPRGGGAAVARTAPIVELAAERETLDPMQLAGVVALGVGAHALSTMLARAAASSGLTIPPILIITTMALALAQVRSISRLPGPRLLGMLGVYLFLTVIGALCDVRALAGLGALGGSLLVFALVTVAVHGVVVFGGAWLLRMDVSGAAVASQANVGGGTSALALAKSLGREDLLVPGILLGSLGNAIGTFAGFLVVRLV